RAELFLQARGLLLEFFRGGIRRSRRRKYRFDLRHWQRRRGGLRLLRDGISIGLKRRARTQKRAQRLFGSRDRRGRRWCNWFNRKRCRGGFRRKGCSRGSRCRRCDRRRWWRRRRNFLRGRNNWWSGGTRDRLRQNSVRGKTHSPKSRRGLGEAKLHVADG